MKKCYSVTVKGKPTKFYYIPLYEEFKTEEATNIILKELQNLTEKEKIEIECKMTYTSNYRETWEIPEKQWIKLKFNRLLQDLEYDLKFTFELEDKFRIKSEEVLKW